MEMPTFLPASLAEKKKQFWAGVSQQDSSELTRRQREKTVRETALFWSQVLSGNLFVRRSRCGRARVNYHIYGFFTFILLVRHIHMESAFQWAFTSWLLLSLWQMALSAPQHKTFLSAVVLSIR